MSDAANHDHRPRLVPAQDARQGKPLGHIRYVLVTSLMLACAAGAVLWLAFFS